MPKLRDLQIAGHVLTFQANYPSGDLTLAIVFNAHDRQSREEAAAIAGIIGDGLTIGGLVLKSVTVDQARLAETKSYGAIVDTSNVDDTILKTAVLQHGIPCLTRHLEQVASGACIVAIRSEPNVSIVVNRANAEAAGVHFATAFRMMVREI